MNPNIRKATLQDVAAVAVIYNKLYVLEGDISYFGSLMRVLRILGELDVFSPLIKEDEMRPNEYFEFAEASKKKQRKRARGNKKPNVQPNTEESEW